MTLQSTTFKSEEKETLKANTDVKLDFSIDEGAIGNTGSGYTSRKKSEVCVDRRTCNIHQGYIHCEIITLKPLRHWISRGDVRSTSYHYFYPIVPFPLLFSSPLAFNNVFYLYYLCLCNSPYLVFFHSLTCPFILHFFYPLIP